MGTLIRKYEPDILAKQLRVVFCGVNPALSAVRDGHNFSARSNRFWKVLHLAGFTDRRIEPQDERSLLDFGIGITAVATRATSRASDISIEEFRDARSAFTAKLRRYRPQHVAFLGKPAFVALTGNPGVEWGRQEQPFAGTDTWVLPNPSGLNRSFALHDLVSAYTELREALNRDT